MLKTKLEALLEKGFSELDGLFGKRDYGEIIKMGATVDDALSPVSIKDIRERIDKASTEEERFIASFSKHDLSDYQNDVLNGTVPFFRRVGFYKGFKVVYNAYTHPELDAYEPVADELVPKVDYEVVEVSWKGNSVVDVLLGRTVDVEHHLADDFSRFPDDIRERMPFLMSLDSHQYDPEKVSEGLMAFLR